MNGHDNIFAVPRNSLGDFTFDDKVANVFPDMIKRSVPGYSSIVQAVGMLTGRFAQPNTVLYDLGCSLGACTTEMRRNAPQNSKIVGIDNSEAMISRARDLVLSFKSEVPTELILGDISTYPLEASSVTVLNLVLQFINPHLRDDLIKKIYDSLVPGGILVLSEKFAFTDPKIKDTLYDLHLDFKRANGYSELEISQKRSSIENVLIPETVDAHRARLHKAGFKSVELWYQCFNFGSLLAIK